jgi:putative transposase
LLRGAAITRHNQVRSTDIAYIRLAHGFAYLVAVMDWYSRRVLSWRVSNTLDAGFCVDCLEEALRTHGRPEIFNTDQGSQFTSEAFTKVLLDAGISISMDGRGRALDNIFVERLWRTVKYEDMYLRSYGGLPELLLGLTEYFAFYNGERAHQGLGNRTPDAVHRSGEGGGAEFVDRFGSAAADCAWVAQLACGIGSALGLSLALAQALFRFVPHDVDDAEGDGQKHAEYPGEVPHGSDPLGFAHRCCEQVSCE